MLRDLLKEEEPIIMPGAYDALTAKIVENKGFKASIMGGYSIAASRLGEPDVGYLSMNEMVQALKCINDAVDMPIVADADTGYGNALSVRRTVVEYEKAGAAAILLEDQLWPKRCGHMEGKEVISKEEHSVKIRAAVEAKKNKDTMIIARTDSRGMLGLEEAISRGKAYLAAGADALFIEAPKNEKELERIGQAFPDTVLIANMVEGGKTPILSKERLKELGFKIIFYPCSLLFAVSKTLENMLEILDSTGTTHGYSDQMKSFGEFNELIGLEEFKRLEMKYKS